MNKQIHQILSGSHALTASSHAVTNWRYSQLCGIVCGAHSIFCSSNPTQLLSVASVVALRSVNTVDCLFVSQTSDHEGTLLINSTTSETQGAQGPDNPPPAEVKVNDSRRNTSKTSRQIDDLSSKPINWNVAAIATIPQEGLNDDLLELNELQAERCRVGGPRETCARPRVDPNFSQIASRSCKATTVVCFVFMSLFWLVC